MGEQAANGLFGDSNNPLAHKIVHGDEFNKNCNLNFTQLFYAWLQILKRDLHGNENLRKRTLYLILDPCR